MSFLLLHGHIQNVVVIMLLRVGQNMFGAKYLIESTQRSLSISSIQRGTRYDKIDRDAKMNEIKNESNPAKKKALMRDLLRGYEVKKAPSQNVQHLDQTLLLMKMLKNNSYVKLNLYIYYVINYGSQRNLFRGRVAADFETNHLEDVGIEIGRSHTEIIEFQKDRIFDTHGLEYNEELAIETIGMPMIDYRWKELKELGIISNTKYEYIIKKWKSFSNEDLINFQSNYLKENGLELKEANETEDIDPISIINKSETSGSHVETGDSDLEILDDYKNRLVKFLKDPNQFKLDTMAQLFKNGEIKNTSCALYLAYKQGAVMRMPFQLTSILAGRSRWERLAKERGIEIDFDFFQAYQSSSAKYDTEIDGLTGELGKKTSNMLKNTMILRKIWHKNRLDQRYS